MAEAVPGPTRRTRLLVLIAASAILFGATLNLVLVAEPAANVRPNEREGAEWSAGTSVAQTQGSQEWTFTVEPEGRRVIDLEAQVPYVVRITYRSGHAELHNELTIEVEGKRVAHASRTIVADPEDNRTDDVQRELPTLLNDFGRAAGPFSVERENDDPFEVRILWTWSYTQSDDARVTFRVRVNPLSLDAVDVAGLPGCGTACGKTLFVLGLAGQIAAVVFWRGKPRAPKHAESDLAIEPQDDAPARPKPPNK